MVCKNCGSPVYEGDRFCSKCGTRVTEDKETKAETLETEPMAPKTSEPVSEPEPEAAEQKPEKAEASEPEAAEQKPEKAEAWEPEAAEQKPEKLEASEPEATEQKPEKAEALKPETPGSASANVKRGLEIPLCIPEEEPSKSPRLFAKLLGHRDNASKPDKPVKWVSKAVLAVFVVAVAVLAANGAKLANSYHRNFSTPEEYYRWVERKTIRKSAGILAEHYENRLLEYLHRYDSHTSSEFRLELGDAGRAMMERAGMEPWFWESALTWDSTCKDSVLQNFLELEMGGQKLLTLDAIIDIRDEAVYLSFPGLTKTYLAVDTGERRFVEGFESVFGMEPAEYIGTLELLEAFYNQCPDKKQVEALANRYLELLLNNIDDVRIRTGKTVRVGSVAQTCTTLEIYLDKNDIQDILSEFLGELQEDPEIEDLLIQLYNMADELGLDLGSYRDADKFYEAFQDRIEVFLDDMDYYITYHNELDMTVYVDDKGQIIGRSLEFPNSWEEVSISYMHPRRGSRFGYRGSITADGVEWSLSGSGKYSWNKIDGSFTTKYDGSGIIDIEVQDFNTKSLKEGYLNGSFTVSASSDLIRSVDLEFIRSYLSDTKLVFDISTKKSSQKCSIELIEGKESWGTLTFSAKSGAGKKISVPSTKKAIFVDNSQALEDWWNTLEWDGLIKKMDKAGAPSEALDAVEQLKEMDMDEIMEELEELMSFFVI